MRQGKPSTTLVRIRITEWKKVVLYDFSSFLGENVLKFYVNTLYNWKFEKNINCFLNISRKLSNQKFEFLKVQSSASFVCATQSCADFPDLNLIGQVKKLTLTLDDVQERLRGK